MEEQTVTLEQLLTALENKNRSESLRLLSRLRNIIRKYDLFPNVPAAMYELMKKPIPGHRYDFPPPKE